MASGGQIPLVHPHHQSRIQTNLVCPLQPPPPRPRPSVRLYKVSGEIITPPLLLTQIRVGFCFFNPLRSLLRTRPGSFGRFIKFFTMAHLPLRRSCTKGRCLQRELHQADYCLHLIIIMKEPQVMYSSCSQIISYIFNMLIYIGKILLDNLL
jgi:hypothetical protein